MHGTNVRIDMSGNVWLYGTLCTVPAILVLNHCSIDVVWAYMYRDWKLVHVHVCI